MAGDKAKNERRMYQVLEKKKNNKISGGQFDQGINDGLDDEEASKTQQDKIQEARKKKDWAGVKRLSEEWRGISGFRKSK